METKDFKIKAEIIQQNLSKLANKKDIMSENGWEIIYSPNNEINDQIREFVHLVYKFDNYLPLYKELCDYKELDYQLGDDLEKRRRERVLWYLDKVNFFIHYIEEYFE